MNQQELQAQFQQNEKRIQKLHKLLEDTTTAMLGESHESKKLYLNTINNTKAELSRLDSKQREIVKGIKCHRQLTAK